VNAERSLEIVAYHTDMEISESGEVTTFHNGDVTARLIWLAAQISRHLLWSFVLCSQPLLAIVEAPAWATCTKCPVHRYIQTHDSRQSEEEEKRLQTPPYLSGNFSPVHEVLPLTPCTYTGTIPRELYGEEYVRNGGNPVTNADLGRDAHWFDGDGMLSGVAFRRTGHGVQPEFVNQFILTDVYLSSVSSSFLRSPILPSVATLANPMLTFYTILLRIFRTILLILLSHLPGSSQAVKKISVANTGILYHDGRALATCESGPPMRVALSGLETVGWYNGKKAKGEKDGEEGPGLEGNGLLSFVKEWTTAHPRVDPETGELVLFHSTFAPPYVHYSTIPAQHPPAVPQTPLETPSRLLNAPIAGVSSAKMMHDFGVSFDHTVIMDLPLSLEPFNLAKNKRSVPLWCLPKTQS
jgi:carotenoid cleavage dioxygenase-like enzyme